jgi:hypothetical protein
MHFIDAALLCISLSTAGGYLMARSDKQIDPPVPKKEEVEATPADATAADAKEVRVGEMPTASALAGAT